MMDMILSTIASDNWIIYAWFKGICKWDHSFKSPFDKIVKNHGFERKNHKISIRSSLLKEI